MPNTAWPVTRLAVSPASPPKKSENIKAIEAISSEVPSVIMANVVPDWRVLTKPKKNAKHKDPSPPTKGKRLTGM